MSKRSLVCERPHFLLPCFLIGLLGVAALACGPPALGDVGPNGLLRFDGPDQLAVGTVAPFSISDANVRVEQLVTVQNVTSSDTSVIKVNSASDSEVMIEALGVGTATLSVTATNADNETVTDSKTLAVREIAGVTLAHVCTSDSRATFLTENPMRVSAVLSASDGTDLYSAGVFPVEIENQGTEASIDDERTSNTHLVIDSGTLGGEARIRATVGPNDLIAYIVERSSIDSIGLEQHDPVRLSDAHDDRVLVATAGQVELCHPVFEYEVRTLSPDICAVSKITVDYGVSVRIVPIAKGECKIDLFAPKGASGEGVRMTEMIEVK